MDEKQGLQRGTAWAMSEENVEIAKRWYEPATGREPRGVTHLDHAGDQNAGLVNMLHVVFVLTIVGLIVAYIVDKV